MILLVPHICFEICVFFRFGSQFCKSDETFFYAQAYEYFIAAYFTQLFNSFCIQLIILFYFIHSLLFQIWFAKKFQKKKKILVQQRFSIITEA